MKPTKQAIDALKEEVMQALISLREREGVTYDMVVVETFVQIALMVFATTNPSKLRDAMRTAEIQARMDGRECVE